MPRSLLTAISAGPIVLAPGAYDGLTARLVARFGFPEWDRLRERSGTIENSAPAVTD